MDLLCRLDGNSCRCTAAQTAHIELKVLAWQWCSAALLSHVQARGASLWHSLGWLDWWAQTQGASKLVAVAVGSDRLTWKLLPLLQYWVGSRVKKVLMLCKFWAIMRYWQQILVSWKNIISMELVRTCCRPKQCLYFHFKKCHCFTNSFVSDIK